MSLKRYIRDAEEDIVVQRMLRDKTVLTRNASVVFALMSMFSAAIGEWSVVAAYSLFGLIFWLDVLITDYRIRTNRFGTWDSEVDQINDWLAQNGGHFVPHMHLPG